MSSWSEADMDRLDGKIIVVTDGILGPGLVAAKEFYKKGAIVIVTGKDRIKGEGAVKEIKKISTGKKIFFEELDLASHSSINLFQERMIFSYDKIDVLINNSDIEGLCDIDKGTKDSKTIFEYNYLGHFVLTKKLFDMLACSSEARLVFVTRVENRNAKIGRMDMKHWQGLNPWDVYAEAKLALLIFALELHNRCLEEGIRMKIIPVHLGGPTVYLGDTEIWFVRAINRFILNLKMNSGVKKVFPILFAATSIEARSGIYYGPDGLFEWWGNPTEVNVPFEVYDHSIQNVLWSESEKFSGHAFKIVNTKL